VIATGVAAVGAAVFAVGGAGCPGGEGSGELRCGGRPLRRLGQGVAVSCCGRFAISGS